GGRIRPISIHDVYRTSNFTYAAARISSRRMIAADTDRLTARLPDGYRARRVEDHDREPLVEEHNADAHPMEYQDAEEWRIWERMAPDDTQIRIVNKGPNGIAGTGHIGAGAKM